MANSAFDRTAGSHSLAAPLTASVRRTAQDANGWRAAMVGVARDVARRG
jgi:hypothetical protein